VDVSDAIRATATAIFAELDESIFRVHVGTVNIVFKSMIHGKELHLLTIDKDGIKCFDGDTIGFEDPKIIGKALMKFRTARIIAERTAAWIAPDHPDKIKNQHNKYDINKYINKKSTYDIGGLKE
jgi:hypothetical protein